MGFNLIRKTAPIAPEDRRPAKTERNQMIMVARSAYDKWRHSFYSCAERTAASALRKRGKKNGRRMRRRKRGRELVRVAFQAQAVGRSPTFSPCGHFWRHLLVSKGGKNCFSQETLQLSFGMSHRFCRPIPSKTSISRNPLRLPSQEDGTDFQFLIFHS